MENWTNLDKGREGVKNPGNFADVICTWPHIYLVSIFQLLEGSETSLPRSNVDPGLERM